MRLLMNIIIAMFTLAWVAAAADNTLGTLKYNPAKSNPAEGQRPYNSLIVTREAAGGGVKQTVHVENANGIKADGSTRQV
jgi:hypothetical protein